MFRFHARRMACGTGAQEGDWAKHWRRPDGSRHPWFAHHGKWAAEKADETEAAMEGEAAAESGPAEVLI
jgi:hypothetical protein